MRRHILFYLLVVLVLGSLIYAAQSTDRTLYYQKSAGVFLADMIGDGKCITGDDIVSGDLVTVNACWELNNGVAGKYDQSYFNDFGINFSAIGQDSGINIQVDNNSFDGVVKIDLHNPNDGDKRFLINLASTNAKSFIVGYDDGSSCGTGVWCSPTTANVCSLNNSIASNNPNINTTIMFNLSLDGSRTAWVYIDDIPCHSIDAFNGIDFLRIIEESTVRTTQISNIRFCTTDICPEEEVAPAGLPATPIYELPTPISSTVNSTNVSLNVSHSTLANDVTYYLYFGNTSTLTEENLYLNNVSRTAEEYSNFTTNVSDGLYFYKWNVQNITDGAFSLNTTQRNWTLDTVTPTITINPNNAFNTLNLSSHNQYLGFMFLNITFNDETGLFGALINVTQNGVSYFNYTNTSLNNTLSHNFTRNISTVVWPDGVFNINITVADGHTSRLIKDYDISKFLSRITFDTDEGNKIDIIGSGAISTEYNRRRDRYEFAFNYLTKKTKRKFTVRCDKELFYISNSRYKGHFVCWNNKGGNWIDFEGIGEDYTLEKISDKEYDITFRNLPLSNKVSVRSIGGLNIVTENYQWFKGSTTNIFNSPATSGSEQQFQMNVTLDFDLVKNINASFTYNNTLRTVTRTDSASSILFDSTFTVPDVNQTLNLSWFFNVTQRNDAMYSFSVNSSQELISSQVNLTVFDEENQSLITEDLTIFFTGPTSKQVNTSSGSLSVGDLEVGGYFIQAESENYPRRGVFFNVTNASSNVNLYLVRDITGNDFIDYIVQDDGRNRLNNVRLTFQKNINNSFVTVAQIETDFAGQARIFQDQQNEYRIVMSLAGFATQTIDLIPLLTTYTLTLSALAEQLFQTIYEGIRYTISPADRVLNASGIFEDISLTVFDGGSSLQFFGLQITNHSYDCIPANCITNITGSPAGGTAVVQINLSEEGSFDTLYFFKRNGFPLQFINGQRSSVRFLIGDRLAENFQVIGANLGTPVMRAIFAAILITILCVLASQIGVVGLGLMLVISFGTIFFMLLGFIPKMVAMITLFFGVAIFFVLGGEQ